MKRFMIGLYGGFDQQKYERDFGESFCGIEACLFEKESDVLHLLSESEQKGFQIGIHFPLRSGAALRDAPFLAQDEQGREEAVNRIQRELDFLASVKVTPAYILFHYPKPVLLDNRVNWDLWRFSDPAEYVFESDYSFEEFAQKSENLFAWLSHKSEEYSFIPVLELDALNRYLYETSLLEDLLQSHPLVKLCLDTSRLFAQERIDPSFDSRRVMKKYAKYAEVIHLSNVCIRETISNRHHPVLPQLRPMDGWAPIEDYLRIIREENQHVRIMFEHRSDCISDDQLEECYSWVNRLLYSETNP